MEGTEIEEGQIEDILREEVWERSQLLVWLAFHKRPGLEHKRLFSKIYSEIEADSAFGLIDKNI